jgi:hypothetical protein
MGNFYRTSRDRIADMSDAQREILSFIISCAENWKKTLVLRGSSIYGVGYGNDLKRWRHPPMVCGLRYGGVKLDDMLRNLYSTEADRAKILDAWQLGMTKAIESKLSLTNIINEFNVAFPNFHFGNGANHTFGPALQFLKLAAWALDKSLTKSYGGFGVSMTSKIHIGISPRAIFLGDRAVRNSKRVPQDEAPLRCVRGLSRMPKVKTFNGTYRLLLKEFPEETNEIEMICNIAVYLGVDAERAITDRFDVVYDKGARAVKTENPVVDARHIIENSIRDPLKDLHALLVPDTLPIARFITLFGAPRGKLRSTYSPEMKQKYLTSLDRINDNIEIEEDQSLKGDKGALLSHLFGV